MESKSFFGKINSQSTYLYKIRSGNMEAEISNYGATLVSLCFMGQRMVLSYDSAKKYDSDDKYFGATVGRTAGRIENAAFSLNGTKYCLDKNDKNNSLHGGADGYNRRIWSVTAYDGRSVTLSLVSEAGDQGYPGRLTVFVTYTLTDNSIIIDYKASSDEDTLCSLTNHSYFNLGGKKVYSYDLRLDSDKHMVLNAELINTGIAENKGTKFDFSKARKISEDFDDGFYISDYDGSFKPVAWLKCNESGIMMTVKTDMPSIQVYTGTFLTAPFSPGDSVCLETQYPPNAINSCPEYAPILKKGEEYRHKTEYVFEKIN